MDINVIRGLATVSAFIAFLAVCYWAFSKKNQKKFDEAAQLPFADEDDINVPKEEIKKDE